MLGSPHRRVLLVRLISSLSCTYPMARLPIRWRYESNESRHRYLPPVQHETALEKARMAVPDGIAPCSRLKLWRDIGNSWEVQYTCSELTWFSANSVTARDTTKPLFAIVSAQRLSNLRLSAGDGLAQ